MPPRSREECNAGSSGRRHHRFGVRVSRHQVDGFPVVQRGLRVDRRHGPDHGRGPDAADRPPIRRDTARVCAGASRCWVWWAVQALVHHARGETVRQLRQRVGHARQPCGLGLRHLGGNAGGGAAFSRGDPQPSGGYQGCSGHGGCHFPCPPGDQSGYHPGRARGSIWV